MVQFCKRMLFIAVILAFPLLTSAQQFKVIGYLTNWGNFIGDANAVDYTKVTHINIAFVNPINNSGDMGPTADLTTVVNIIHSNNVKALASIGGASPPSFLKTLVQPAYRTGFITKLAKFVDTYNLDGIDVDFEGSSVDANFGPFIQQLSDSLKKRNKLLTAAVGTWYANSVPNSSLPYFDWVNIMSYDAYGTWTNYGEHSTYQFALNDIDTWSAKGLTKDQIVVGLPFYGYRWETNSKTSLSYCSIISLWPRAINKDTINTATGGKLSHNGIPTIKKKTALAYEQGGGVMFWTIQYDCPTSNPNSLLLAINQTISDLTGNIKPTVTLTAPLDGATFTEGEQITISADANDVDGTVQNVSFYNGSVKIGEATTAPYSINWFAEAGTYKIYARAMDNTPATTFSDTANITINAGTTLTPYGGTPWPIPGKIEAENFDIGGGLGYHDLDATNSGGEYRSTGVDIEMCSDVGGGYNVGWVNAGEWLLFTTKVEMDSLYDIEIRYASNSSAGGLFEVELNGSDATGNIALPSTSGWQTWQSVIIKKVRLYAGQQMLKMNMVSGSYNINYVNIIYNDPLANLFISNNNNSNLSIYPNPIENQSTLKLTLEDHGMAKVSILDLAGKELMSLPEQYLSQGDNLISIDGSQLKAGLYLCKVIYNGKVSTIAFTKH